MLHPPRFLQTILARPDDDAPRLRYANWLEGCGNPLGEFIRLQCLLARQPAGAPSLAHERRSQALLADHRKTWSSVLAGRVEWCSFRRGFIEEISLTEKQLIHHGPELFRLAPVFELHVTGDGRRLDALPQLPRLRHTLFMDVSSQPICDTGVEKLAESELLAQVHGLNLGNCHVGDVGIDALIEADDLGSLRELYLNDNPVTDDSIRRFVMSPLAEQLDWLDVRQTQISHEGIEALRHVLGDRMLC